MSADDISTRTILGYDPGGDGAHGVAVLHVDDGQPRSLTTVTLETTEEVIATLEHLPVLSAIGVDTLTCWSTGPGGWRPADRWLRDRYTVVANSIVSPNALYGAMGLNGMGVLITARHRWRRVLISEAHPKVLYWHLTRQPYNYEEKHAEMDAVLSRALNVKVATANEHEWDAGMSALAACCGLDGHWTEDLHALPTGDGERLIQPCGETHYYWPGVDDTWNANSVN